MKKIILTLMLIFSANALIKAQQNGPLPTKDVSPFQLSKTFVQGKTFLISNSATDEHTPPKDYDYYNRKSRNQRITGLSLLGGGLLLGVAGALVSSSNANSYQSNGQTAVALFIISAAAGLTSIPFMILAHASKTRARAALSTQKTYIPGKGNNYITGLSVSLPIGK